MPVQLKEIVWVDYDGLRRACGSRRRRSWPSRWAARSRRGSRARPRGGAPSGRPFRSPTDGSARSWRRRIRTAASSRPARRRDRQLDGRGTDRPAASQRQHLRSAEHLRHLLAQLLFGPPVAGDPLQLRLGERRQARAHLPVLHRCRGGDAPGRVPGGSGLQRG